MAIFYGNKYTNGFYGASSFGLAYYGSTEVHPGVSLTPPGPTLPPVTTDLALYLTTYEASSYPGSGNTWFDISGNGIDFTLNNPDFYTADDGFNYFYFANDGGTSRYATNTANFTTGMPAVLDEFGQRGTYFYIVHKNADKNFGLFSCLGSINDGSGANNDFSQFQRHSIANSGIWVNRMYFVGATAETNTINFNDGNVHLAVARWDNNTNGLWDVYVDGQFPGQSTNNNNGQFTEEDVRRVTFGLNSNLSDDPLDGDVAEVIWYNRRLNDTELASVISFLQTRYSI